MQRRIIINLILVSAVIGLAVFLMNTRKQPANPVKPLTTIPPQIINRLDIIRSGKQEISFSKRDKVWYMTAPLKVRANDNRINAMLQLLHTPSFTRLRAAGRDLDRFDLASPKAILREDAHEFHFGGTNPLEGRRYVMYQGTIHLIPDVLFPQLQQGPAFFISPRLLPEGVRLREIRLPGQHLSFVNHDWQSDPPVQDNAAAKRRAHAWLMASAVTIGSVQPQQSGGEIRITTENGAVIRFEILQRKPILKLARTDLGLSYTMPAGSDETLLPEPVKSR